MGAARVTTRKKKKNQGRYKRVTETNGGWKEKDGGVKVGFW